MSSQKVPVIPAISDDVPINTRRVLLAMKTTIEYLLQQTGATELRFGGTAASGGTSVTTHNALDGIQGGATALFYHLTDTQHTDLTDAGNSALHFHNTDRDLANATGTLPWGQVSKTGAVLSDFGSLYHDDLTRISGGAAGSYYHLTGAHYDGLTSAGDSSLHYHSTDRARANHTGTQLLATISNVTITAANLNALDDGLTSALHFHAADRARANHTGTQLGATVTLPTLQAATRDDVTDWFNAFSSGQITGGTVSATGTQIEVTAGEGTIKSGVAITDPTFYCKWSALALTTVTDARVTWVCVDYNAGNPAILLLETATNSEPAALNYNSCWPLGYVVREGTVLHVTNNPRKMQDAIGGLIRRFHQTLPFARDELVGGLLIAETGTRNITLTAGYLFDRQNRFTISAINTSVAGTFDRYYRAVSGFTKEASQTQWPNTQYDDGSGTLVTMTNNRYANLYWYLETDSNLVMAYGRDQFVSAAAAALESVPATLPLRTLTDGRLIARTTFQKSAATFTSVDSAFTNTFAASATGAHNNLSGLQGGAASEYYHLTSAEYAVLGQTSNVISTPTILAADKSYTVVGYLTISSDFTVNGNVGII